MLSLDFIRQHPDVVREGLRRRCDSQSIDEILHLAELRRGLATRCDGLMAAILESYQQADGSIVMPKVLRPYMGISSLS